MKFVFFNDTGKEISIHPGSVAHNCENNRIQHLQKAIFEVPEGCTPFVKMWDYSDYGMGLSLLVSAGVLE